MNKIQLASPKQEMDMNRITVEKPKARYRVVIELQSGKKEIRWVDSKYSVDQICEEYLVSTSSVKWVPMR